MILCDQIITDRFTGKQSLIGIFSRLHAPGFPVSHPQLSVYVTLTDGYGEVDLLVRIVDTNDARPAIVEGKGKVNFQNPRAIANLGLSFHGLRFPEQGEYRVQLYCDGELLREARLDVVQVKPRKRPPPEGMEGAPPRGA